MIPKRIETVGAFRIVVDIDDYGCASVTYSDITDKTTDRLPDCGLLSATDGIESLVCAMAYNGFNIADPTFCDALDSAVFGLMDKYSEQSAR